MKKFIVIVTSIVLLAAFLWTSTGITIYSHYCSLSDNVNTSLFVDDAVCDHHIEKAVTQSCCDEKKSCSSKMKDTDCCATQKQVFKIASLFNVPDNNKKVIILNIILLEHILIHFEKIDDLHTKVLQNTEQLPPGIYGKELLLTIHQQKIAPAPIV